MHIDCIFFIVWFILGLEIHIHTERDGTGLRIGHDVLCPVDLGVGTRISRPCHEVLALCIERQVAKDLRQISAALKMITDMERIGDQAADIAEIITFLKGRSCENCEAIGEG